MSFFDDIMPPNDLIASWAKEYEDKKDEREAERLKTIFYHFDEFADSDEARMGLVELIEACGGEVPSDICTSCGSDEARYTSHYNNNAECN